jgi:MFS family permease
VTTARPATAARAARAAGAFSAFSASLGDVARPLKDHQFRWLWLATFAWNFARWMEMTVTGWVALELTGSAWLVAVVGVCRNAFLPVAGPITGALSDRFDRVRLMKAAQWGNVLVIGAVALALATGRGAYWQLVVASLWLGASWGIDWPSRRALMADMVGPERVLQAIVLDNVTQNISRILGPLIAGYLLAGSGGPGAFAGLTAAFLVASLTLLAVNSQVRTRVHVATNVLRDLGSGLRYARADSVVWAVLVITVFMNMLLFPYMTLMSVFAEEVLHVGPVGLGQLGALNGVGAALGLFVLSPMRTGRVQARAFAAGSLLGCTCVTLFALSRSFELSLALLFASGLGTSAFGTMQSTLILSRTDPSMRGRAMGLLAFAIGTAPAGSLALGLLVEQFGPQTALALTCSLCAALTLWAALGGRLFFVPPPTPTPDKPLQPA